MTDIEKKALEQAVAAAGRRMQDYAIMAEENVLRQSIVAHARAIEQHEAFKREVSDAVEDAKRTYGGHRQAFDQLERFIIAKPDPLVEAYNEALPETAAVHGKETVQHICAKISAAIEARGGRIVWEGE